MKNTNLFPKKLKAIVVFIYYDANKSKGWVDLSKWIYIERDTTRRWKGTSNEWFDLPFIFNIAFLISTAQFSQCIYTLSTTIITLGCENKNKLNIQYKII